MSDKFFKEVDKMFEEKLKYEEVPTIRVKNLKTNTILENLNYDKVRFDVNLNMYKLMDDGSWAMVNNPDFKPVIVYKDKYIKSSQI